MLELSKTDCMSAKMKKHRLVCEKNQIKLVGYVKNKISLLVICEKLEIEITLKVY